MSKPTILILHASGTNRDGEAARAVEVAGGAPHIFHINRLRAGEVSLAEFDALLLPGGFSYGDALGAGARLALDLQIYFAEAMGSFVESGKPVLGICNGFQTLVKAGILPETNGRQRTVTLTENARGHFECRWVHLRAASNARASWIAAMDDLIFCPIAHGEGNVQVTDEETQSTLEAEGLVAFRYVDSDGSPVLGEYPFNPNGSVADIAGLCNRRGNVVGLMPHPEDHILPIQNPLRHNAASLDGLRLGLPLFRRFVDVARHGIPDPSGESTSA